MRKFVLSGFASLCVLVAAVVLLATGGPGRPSSGADHRDAPGAEANKPADITDVYAFRSPANSANLVLGLGVNGLTAPADNLSANFSNAVTYMIHVDLNSDLVDDATVNINFAGSGATQTYTITGLPGGAITGDVTPPSVDPTAPAPKIKDQGGIKSFAGQRDDAFFFDLTCFKKFKAAPYVPTSGLCKSPDQPSDTFKGTNVSYIVIEFPISAIADPNTGVIQAWASTSQGAQVDRMAIPALNTALIPTAQKDAFNAGAPATDAATFQSTVQTEDQNLRTAVNAVLDGPVGPEDGGPFGQKTPAEVADIVQPDIVRIDFSQPVQFTNGRQLTDDVIDTALKLVLNRTAGITDAISGNDVAFLSTFPYFAPPHQPAAVQATATPTTGATAAPTTAPQPAAVPETGGEPGDGADLGWPIGGTLIAGALLTVAGAVMVIRRRLTR
ncbi:MAG: DUF4331 domain-containing protein [Chloroflexi bacterium]|nr:MAG: DUF4331 domain-containing protein [Chloroflexota bacterium]